MMLINLLLTSKSKFLYIGNYLLFDYLLHILYSITMIEWIEFELLVIRNHSIKTFKGYYDFFKTLEKNLFFL